MRARQFPGGILPDLLRLFFLPFFYDFGGILLSGNADGEAKIGSGPPKSDAALSQDIHRILNSFTLLPLRSCNDRSRPSTENPVPHLHPRWNVFITLSRAFISIFSFSPRLLSRNREPMGKYHERPGSKWLSDFYFLTSLTHFPSSHLDITFPRFLTFPTNMRGNSFFSCL